LVTTARLSAAQMPLDLNVAGQPTTLPSGWSATATATPETPLPAAVAALGPGLRITPQADLALFKPMWRLTGAYAVSASVQRQPSSAASAGYGLVVGGDTGAACLVRPDGAVALSRLTAGRITTALWVPLAGGGPKGAMTLDRVEVRVRSTAVECGVNGTVVASMPIQPGQLDGVPGVYVGAQADVAVVGFSISGSHDVVNPSTIK
jgi:hypothetical protein